MKNEYTVKRRIDLDCISGLMIITMLLVHISDFSGTRNVQFLEIPYLIFQFFMAWFFYKSGMFHSDNDLLKRSIRRLIIPWCVFTLIGVVVKFSVDSSYSFRAIVVEILFGGASSGNTALWFLFSLFICRILFSLCVKMHISPFMLVGISFILAFAHNLSSISMPYYLGNIPLGLAFYSLGFWLKNKQYLDKLFVWSLIIYIIYLISGSGTIGFYNNSTTGIWVICVMGFISGCVLVNNMFYRFQFLNNKALCAIGRNTMPIYLIHWPILCIIQNVLKQKDICEGGVFIINLFVVSIFCGLFVLVLNSRWVAPYKRLFGL